MPQPSTNNIATINLPTGKLVYVVASSQAGAAQSVTIKDSGGATAFSASSAAGGGPFKVIGSGTFTSAGNGTFTVTLTQGSKYLIAENTTSLSGAYVNQQYTIAANDSGGDADYNDLVVQILCFGFKG